MSAEQKRRPLITGASSGIGKAMAKAIAKAGINVALVSCSLDKLEGVREAIEQTWVEAKAYAVDLGRISEVKKRSKRSPWTLAI